MATLESAITIFQNLGFYSILFPLILISVLMYGLLTKLEVFGNNKSVNLAVSFVVALIFISFSGAVQFINMLIPYFVILMVILLLLIMLFMFMGAETGDIMEVVKHPAGYGVIIAVFIIVIFMLISITAPSSQIAGEQDQGQTIFEKLIFNPPVLGLIMLVAVFGTATYMITRTEE